MHERSNLTSDESWMSLLEFDWCEEYETFVNNQQLDLKKPESIPAPAAIDSAQTSISPPLDASSTETLSSTTPDFKPLEYNQLKPAKHKNDRLAYYVDAKTCEPVSDESEVMKFGKFYFSQHRWVVWMQTIIDRPYKFVESDQLLTTQQKMEMRYNYQKGSLFWENKAIHCHLTYHPRKFPQPVAEKAPKRSAAEAELTPVYNSPRSPLTLFAQSEPSSPEAKKCPRHTVSPPQYKS